VVSSVTESKASAKGQSKTKSGGGDSNTSDQEATEKTNFAQSKGGAEADKSPSQTGDGMFNTGNTQSTNESGTGMKSQAGGGGAGTNSSGGTSIAATVL
jgi:hypothetical protein